MNVNELSDLLDYQIWADNQLCAILQEVSPSEYQKDFGFPLRSLKTRCVHLVSALELWFDRINGKPSKYAEKVAFFEKLTLNELCDKWQEANASFKELLLQKNVRDKVTYTNSKGNTYSNHIYDIFRHVVLHTTYHRAQIMLLLRTIGKKIHDLDYIFYIRENGG